MPPTFEQVRQTLESAGEQHHVMTFQHQTQVIITRRGGRLLGPYPAPDAESLYWVNPALATPHAFRDFVAEDQWNMGGERVWIAPEIQYIIQDRKDFWGTHRLPTAIDPGHYTLSTSGDRVTLAQEVELHGYNTATGNKHLGITRSFRQVENPLRALAGYDRLMNGVRFAGYEQAITVNDLGGDPMHSESWCLVQLNAGGNLVIPASDGAEVSPYFGDPTDDALNQQNGRFRIQITGQRQYKTGYKAAYLTGRMGYLNRVETGMYYLLIRNFFNDPTTVYAEEPPDTPGNQGHSVHVYNDGGQFGGFGEMEASGRTVGGSTRLDTITDAFVMWIYMSDNEKSLKDIGHLLLGVSL